MSKGLQPVCDRVTPCKCCGAMAALFGVVDFHKNCEIYRRKVLDTSGVPIYYYRCPTCQFLFTTAFDHFKLEDFQRFIYNDDYLLVDPDYQESRPRSNAAWLCSLFPAVRPLRLLDYGGGNGILAESLRAAGFPHAETYDPFVAGHSVRPSDRFDCIVSFEVLEHATDPRHVFADMNELLTASGIIVCSTLLQPADIDRQGLSWWYAGPRNGHVSLHSRTSLETVVRPFGFRFGSFNDCFHLLYRNVPDFARHLIRS
jgi:SAM-dependent methyltransferase